jgi:hypothetical protein
MLYYIGKDITEAVQGHAVNPPDKCITNQPQTLFQYDTNYTAMVGHVNSSQN